MLRGQNGEYLVNGTEHTSLGKTKEVTSDKDTKNLINKFIDHQVEIIVYAGGDGTTRDIVNALGENEIPLIGVPSGVKMHSGCFATTPKQRPKYYLPILLEI